jgi:hypothetical protein
VLSSGRLLTNRLASAALLRVGGVQTANRPINPSRTGPARNFFRVSTDSERPLYSSRSVSMLDGRE